MMREMSEKCANCGSSWGDHAGEDCPGGRTKFSLMYVVPTGGAQRLEQIQQDFRDGVELTAFAGLDNPAPVAAATGLAATLEERGRRYGKFTGHANVAQALKRTISANLESRKKYLASDQQEALDMICHKIARIVNGDPDYADSWVDIAGYAKLVADRLEGGAA